jgi:tRNA(Arg) A34 adenosine deaminase TadA
VKDIVRHEELMSVCFKLAASAREKGNHPFGALLALDDRVMLTAENSIFTNREVTAHAEQNLVSAASSQFEPALIKNLTLYTSTEPCAMCAGAIYWAGIRSVVYGCPAETLGELTGREFVVPCRHIFRYAKQPVKVVGPILEKEAALLHEGFWSR